MQERLMFNFDVATQADASKHVLGNRVFEPLFRVRNFDVSINCILDFDDDFLGAMSRAWPALGTFECNIYRRWGPGKPRATVAGLIPLAQNCPDLFSLELALGIGLKRKEIDLEKLPGGGMHHSPLENMQVGFSVVSDTEALAAFLSGLFPQLWLIGTGWPVEEDEDAEYPEEEWEKGRVLAELHVTVERASDDAPDQARKFFAALAEHRSRRMLQILEFNFNVGVQVDGTKHVLGNNIFKPLLTLPRVDKLEMSMNCVMDFDDNFIAAMSRAWPALRKFESNVDHRWGEGKPRMTLAGLVPLSQNCPDLFSIGLTLDANLTGKDIDLEKVPKCGEHQSFLEEMHVGYSIVNDPELLIRFLSGLFPHLRFISTAWPNAHEDEEAEHPDEEWEEGRKWAQVKVYFPHDDEDL
ncbi:hypothetical protein SCP_0700290 [Sparassis crispa]|uniref:F-box domain-containing protein n=1 Tax=Sparassis crispa TaxID=139825 RepID=A0A401GRQ6_9APHY|nr:hypothetical protein SCP_0700290 [Sparassis crispa]GBE84849.1 hypothetical protein SCP_0700290 [Sparassis crispa]